MDMTLTFCFAFLFVSLFFSYGSSLKIEHYWVGAVRMGRFVMFLILEKMLSVFPFSGLSYAALFYLFVCMVYV